MFILKLFGSILIVGSTTLIGLELASSMKKRIVLLRGLKSSLMMLQTEIQFTITPLPEALENVSYRLQGCLKEFYGYLSSRLLERNGETVSEVFMKGIQELLYKTHLKQEDMDILIHLSKSLGSSDIDGQTRTLLLGIESLNENIRKAVEFQEKNEKMYRVLGILSGLSIAIVLF